jgi:cytochrome c biogenesis protein CcmG/thiol:disulfide interchange protein DsbE
VTRGIDTLAPVLRRRATIAALVTFLAACSGSDVDVTDVPELPVASVEQIQELLATSETPIVLNVWASWCIPCRSEAPLLAEAAKRFDDSVRFVGLDVRDSQDDARAFLAEFFAGAPIEHFFDRPGDIPVELGGSRAVPLTFFYAAEGALVDVHTGVLDERTLAIGIDEIVAGS